MRGAPFGSTAGGFGAGDGFVVAVLGLVELVELEEGFVELLLDAGGFAAGVADLLVPEVFEEEVEDFELSEVAALAGAIATAEAIRT
jgi:hypothetical protein